MEALRKKGIKEVVLTGIDIAAYRDPASGMGLKDLLLLFDGLPTPPRIRLSSVDPDYLDDAFIAVLAASGKVAKSIHIPVQSGSDRILKAMGRGYGSAFIAGLVKKLKKRIPAIGIGMDIMAGFPGEDEVAFDETCAFIEALDVSYLHVFPYSERPGARACRLRRQGGRIGEKEARQEAEGDRRDKKRSLLAPPPGEKGLHHPRGEDVCGAIHERFFRQLSARLHPL